MHESPYAFSVFSLFLTVKTLHYKSNYQQDPILEVEVYIFFEIICSVLKAKNVHLKSTLQYKMESKCVRADFTILLTDRTWSLEDEDSCRSVVFRHLAKILSWTLKVIERKINKL